MRGYFLKSLLIMLALAMALPVTNASARVFIGGGVVVGAPYYYYPPYYAYYPPYPYPPAYPPYGAPPASAYYPVPPPSAQDRYYTAGNGEYCREYRHTIVVEGERQEAFGHACREPGGSWRIMD